VSLENPYVESLHPKHWRFWVCTVTWHRWNWDKYPDCYAHCERCSVLKDDESWAPSTIWEWLGRVWWRVSCRLGRNKDEQPF